MRASLIAGKAMAQTVMVAVTASEGSNDDGDNFAMAVLLWLRRRYGKSSGSDLQARNNIWNYSM